MGSPHHFNLINTAHQRIGVLGPSAGGKGEYATAFIKAAQDVGLPAVHLESGNLFRAALSGDPDLRRQVNAGKVIETLDPIADQVVGGYRDAIKVIQAGGYVIEDGLHRRPQQVSVETPFWFADAALQHGRTTPVYDSRSEDQKQLIVDANEAMQHMRFVMMDASPLSCFALMQERYRKALQAAHEMQAVHNDRHVAPLLNVLDDLLEHNQALVSDNLQGGDLRYWTSQTIAHFIQQAAYDAGLPDVTKWTDPTKLLHQLMPEAKAIKFRMDDMIPQSAIDRTTTCKIPPSEEGGKWELGPVGKTAESIGYKFDPISGAFSVPAQHVGRLAIVHNPGLVDGGYAQLQENCRNQAMRWIEEDRKEGMEGEMTRSAAMRR